MKQVQVKEMSTIQDVAKRARVGAATVSRVLNGNGYVKEETREKVMQAIQELNYTPNEMARNLFFKRTGIVAIIIPQISHPFFAEFVDEAMLELAKYDYKVMVCNTWDESHYELQYLEMLERSMVDGIIFGAHSLNIKEYQNTRRPIVALDRELGAGIPCVSADHEEGGRLAAEVLIGAGCRKSCSSAGKRVLPPPPSSAIHALKRFSRTMALSATILHRPGTASATAISTGSWKESLISIRTLTASSARTSL